MMTKSHDYILQYSYQGKLTQFNSKPQGLGSLQPNKTTNNYIIKSKTFDLDQSFELV